MTARVIRAAGACLLLVAAAAPSGCTVAPDLKGPCGMPPCADRRDAWVAVRAEAPVPGPGIAGPQTLGDLLRLVDRGSVSVQQARARVLQAEALVSVARSDLLPDLSINADWTGFARAPGSLGFQTDRHVGVGLIELRFPLDLAGGLAASVRAAQARYRSEDWNLEATIREQRLLVCRSYFTHLAARDLAAVNDALIALQERSVQDGRARYDAGVIRKNDVLVLEVALSNSRQRAVTLESAVIDARRALNAAVGLPIDRPTEVATFEGLIPVVADVVSLLDQARRDNPEVDALVETREALLHELVANERAGAPEGAAGANVSGTTQEITDPKENFTGFLSLSWNPDLSGRLLAERTGIRARLLELAWTVTGLLRRLEQQALGAHQTTIERTSAIRAAEASIEQARENLRIVQELFRTGVNTGRDELEAQALLFQQEATLKAARHQVNSAQFELRWLAGTDLLAYYEAVAARAETRPGSR